MRTEACSRAHGKTPRWERPLSVESSSCKSGSYEQTNCVAWPGTIAVDDAGAAPNGTMTGGNINLMLSNAATVKPLRPERL
jgi:hypothetical protein